MRLPALLQHLVAKHAHVHGLRMIGMPPPRRPAREIEKVVNDRVDAARTARDARDRCCIGLGHIAHRSTPPTIDASGVRISWPRMVMN